MLRAVRRGNRRVGAAGIGRVGRSNGAKVVASLAAVAAGAGIAGLGTFATFEDAATPLDAAVDGGVVSIDLRDPDRLGTVPLAFGGGVLPGGSASRTVRLANDGDTELGAVRLSAVARTSSLLDTDPRNGLQLTVRSCSVPWAPGLVCAGEQRTLVAPGPVLREVPLDGPTSLAAGGSDHLALTVSLPESAGNAFAGLNSALEFTFTAVQRAGTAR
jgi:hypothetical protein